MINFSARLKELRIGKQLTQKEVGEFTGVGQSSISAWERGDRQPLASQLVILARYFECSVDYLLGLTDC